MSDWLDLSALLDFFREGRGASSKLKLFKVFLTFFIIMFILWRICVSTQPALADSFLKWLNDCQDLISQAFTPSVSANSGSQILATSFNTVLLVAEIAFIGWFVWWKRLLKTLQRWRSNPIQEHPLFWSVSALVAVLLILFAATDAVSGSGSFFSFPFFLPVFYLLDRLYFISSALDSPFQLAGLNWLLRYGLVLLSAIFFRIAFPILRWLFDKAIDSFKNALNYSTGPTPAASASTDFWDALANSLLKKDSTGKIIGIYYEHLIFLLGFFGLVMMAIRYFINPAQTVSEFSAVLDQAYLIIDGLFFLSALPKEESSLPIWQLFANFFQVLLRFAMAYLYLLILQFIVESFKVIAWYLKSIPRSDFIRKIKWLVIISFAVIVIIGGAWLLISVIGQENASDWPNPWIDGIAFAPIFVALLNITAAVFAVLVFVTIITVSLFAIIVLFVTLWAQIGLINPSKLKILYSDKSKRITDALWYVLGRFGGMLRSVLDVIPFIACNTIDALKVQIMSLLGIIRGFEKESDKNRALMLAAVLASISSILNTYFGLASLFGSGNEGNATAINHITAVLVSLAVQLFLLITGIKAGEGLAEGIFLRQPKEKEGSGNKFIDFWNKIVDLLKRVHLFNFLIKILKFLINLLLVDTTSDRVKKTSVRRVPPWLYLCIFFLLMFVSTSFAYNNLFSFYSISTKLPEIIHNNVEYASKSEYDDVKNGYILSGDLASSDSVEGGTPPKVIGLEQFIFNRADALISKYNSNTMEMLKLLDCAYNGTVYAPPTSLPTSAPASTPTSIPMTEARNRARATYTGGQVSDETIFDFKTDGWQNYFNALVEIIQIGDLGSIDITADTYHYAFDNGQYQVGPKYNSVEFTVKEHGGSEIDRVVNKKSFPNKKDATQGVPGSFETNYTNYNGILTTQTTLGTNQFELIRMILIEFNGRSQELYLEANGEPLEDGASSTFNMPEFVRLLRDNELIFRQYRSALSYMEGLTSAQTAGEPDRFEGGVASVRAIITEILKNDQPFISVDKRGETLAEIPESRTSPASLAASYNNHINPYIDKIAALSRLLAQTDEAEATQSLNSEDNPEPEISTDDGSFEDAMESARDKTNRVSTYLNYAQTSNSSFILSYDVLLKGALGINPAPDRLKDVYSSHIFAVLLLLVAGLIDLMAFFIGLMLFKSIYLFRKDNKTVSRFGYIQFDSALRSIFALSKNASLRSLQQMFIDSLLYGNNGKSAAAAPAMSKRAERRERVRYRKYSDRIHSTLQSVGIDLTNAEDRGALIVWLSDFINTV